MKNRWCIYKLFEESVPKSTQKGVNFEFLVKFQQFNLEQEGEVSYNNQHIQNTVHFVYVGKRKKGGWFYDQEQSKAWPWRGYGKRGMCVCLCVQRVFRVQDYIESAEKEKNFNTKSNLDCKFSIPIVFQIVNIRDITQKREQYEKSQYPNYNLLV